MEDNLVTQNEISVVIDLDNATVFLSFSIFYNKRYANDCSFKYLVNNFYILICWLSSW